MALRLQRCLGEVSCHPHWAAQAHSQGSPASRSSLQVRCVSNSVPRESPHFGRRNAHAQDVALSATEGRTANAASTTWMPELGADWGFLNQRDDVDMARAVLSAATEETSGAGYQALRDGLETLAMLQEVQLPWDIAADLDALPGNEEDEEWSFQAEDFQWADRRDPLTTFSSLEAASSTSYDRIWDLRKKHGLWFPADQASHPQPAWSLNHPADLQFRSEVGNTEKQMGGKAAASATKSSDVWVLDSSFLVALLDSDDLYSPLCLRAVELMGKSRKVLTQECVTEATQLIRSKIRGIRGAQLELFLYRCIETGVFEVVCPGSWREWSMFARLLRYWRQTRLGNAASSVLALAERLSTPNVATLDKRAFDLVAPKHTATLNLLPN